MSTPTTVDNLAERQEALTDSDGDALAALVALVDAIQNAGDCETPADFDANLNDARDACRAMLKAIDEVLS